MSQEALPRIYQMQNNIMTIFKSIIKSYRRPQQSPSFQIRAISTALSFAIVFSAALFFCNHNFAASTKFWKQTEQTNFIKGKVNNAAIYSDGKIKLSYKREDINGIDASYVWSVTGGNKGDIYAGTGDPGIVYKITGNNAVEIFRQPGELHIQSLATDLKGNVYAGTSPKGIIYKIDNNLKSSVFCRLPELYIWDLAIDNKGALFAATGPNGKIYRISETGNADILLDSEAAHILDIEIDKDNFVYACTEPFGLIYKISPQGKPAILYDVKEEEAHCLALGKDGIVYAGTADGGKLQMPPSPEQMLKAMKGGPPRNQNRPAQTQNYQWPSFGLVDKQTGVKPANKTINQKIEGLMSKMGAHFAGGNSPATSNSIYRILPDGTAGKILNIEHAFVFSIIADNTNNVFAGTGNNASIYWLNQPEKPLEARINPRAGNAVLFNVTSSQVFSMFMMDNGQFFVGTGNPGEVFKVSNGFSANGVYESAVYDTFGISKWGRISYNAELQDGTTIQFFTRTGNSKIPDNTWNDWTSAIEEDVSANGLSKIIKSAPARFIQYQAILSTTNPERSPILDNVCIAYLPKNQPPSIEKIEITCDHETTAEASETGQPQKYPNDEATLFPRPKEPQTKVCLVKTITWKANDPDNDNLLYDIFFRRNDQEGWRTLAEKICNEHSFQWNTANAAHGKYIIKITANDSLSNPKDLAMQTDNVSNEFIIDYAAPTIIIDKIEQTANDSYNIKGSTIDDISNIAFIQYAIDANDAVPVFPLDGIFDYTTEDFEFELTNLPKGMHFISIKADDAEGNSKVEEITVNVK